MNKDIFINELAKIGISINEYQLEQFNKYYLLLIEYNNKVNLTAITKEDEVYEKHFYDSILTSLVYSFTNEKICDVGSGAGFPSICLKIIYPNLDITIVDSLNKRISFLDILVKELKLDNVKLIHARAEDISNDYRNYFDIVMARAVARLNILSELCLPLLKIDGYFIALKAKDALNELEEANNALKILKTRVDNVKEYHLYTNNDIRYLIKLYKYDITSNKYPRLYSIIKKKPL